MKKFRLVPLLLLALVASTLLPHAARATGEIVLRLATTTSTVDTGLFDTLLPPFTERYGIRVDVLSVGTGKALKLAENGDVDVVLVHSRKAEDAFLASGFGVNPLPVMYNDFVILGPAEDPAGIAAATAAPAALAAIAGKGAPFVSRGDKSGTHDREMELWAAAGSPAFGPWRLESGQGMGATLVIAHEKHAYCLADRATYLAFSARIDLKVLFEGGEPLLNRYRVICVHPGRHPKANYVAAMAFAGYLTSPEGQARIGDFRKDGHALFHPDFLKD